MSSKLLHSILFALFIYNSSFGVLDKWAYSGVFNILSNTQSSESRAIHKVHVMHHNMQYTHQTTVTL